jgi:hypothetical protein
LLFIPSMRQTGKGPIPASGIVLALALAAFAQSGCQGSDSQPPGPGDLAMAPGPGDGATPPGRDSAVAPDGSGVVPPAKVPIFIAQGFFGRTTFSCDDGKTWVGNRSWDLEGDPMMCGMKQSASCDDASCSFSPQGGACQQTACCNDSPDAPKGIAYGNGVFAASWGWGGGGWGTVRRSTNGIDWTETYPSGGFGDVAFGAGHFVAASRSPLWSTDGATWNDKITADYRDGADQIVWSVRRMGYADTMGGRFVTYATPNAAELVSSDGGQTWWKPTVWPADCAAGGISSYGDILYGNGAIVIVDYAGTACRSIDGGVTWATSPTGVGTILSRGVWTGSEFRFWGQGVMISSPDGVTWKQTALPGAPWIEGPVVRSPVTGTYVAIANLWDGYAKQSFLRSTDGVSWQALPAGSFAPSHPLMYMTFGYVDPSAACPAP